MTLPKNNHVMKGTDLTSSIIAVQIIRIIGNVDVLPNASITPNGNDIAIPKKASSQVKANPPYIEDPGTTIKLSEVPPLMRSTIMAVATVQVINKLLAVSFELATVGATVTRIQNKNNSNLTCLMTGRV